jgi:hypothetical protein
VFRVPSVSGYANSEHLTDASVAILALSNDEWDLPPVQ